MSEQLWSIPNHWSWVKASEIAKIVGGGTPKSHDETNFSENGIPWITPADLTGYDKKYISRGRRDLSQKGLETSGARLLPKGSVLFSSRAPIGYCVIAENPISTNQGFKSLVLNENALPEYIQYYLIATREYAKSIASGTTFLELSGSRMAHYPIPLPPLEEQRRIVAKLDVLLGRNKAGRQELSAATQLIKRQRQAVLAQAFSGELTADWREEMNITFGKNIELGTVTTSLAYGTSAKSQAEGDVPVLRMGNIQNCFIDWSDLVYTSDASEIKKYALRKGDVLFNRTNSPELVGKTALYRGEREAIYAGYIIRIRCNSELLPEYLNYCLNSPMGREYCWQVKSDGVSQSNINAKKLAAFTFTLPSLEEQREIVRRIEAAFARIDEGEQAIKQAFTLAERLEQATLAKAFRGEL
jgi:type I restriction enzyme S subunit